jgi:hypothetical protein
VTTLVVGMLSWKRIVRELLLATKPNATLGWSAYVEDFVALHRVSLLTRNVSLGERFGCLAPVPCKWRNSFYFLGSRKLHYHLPSCLCPLPKHIRFEQPFFFPGKPPALTLSLIHYPTKRTLLSSFYSNWSACACCSSCCKR